MNSSITPDIRSLNDSVRLGEAVVHTLEIITAFERTGPFPLGYVEVIVF